MMAEEGPYLLAIWRRLCLVKLAPMLDPVLVRSCIRQFVRQTLRPSVLREALDHCGG